MADTEPISVHEWEKLVHPLADTSIVIMSTTVLEGWVASAIKTKMRALPQSIHNRIFQGYGPLSTFSAKIDIGYALKLYDEKICRDLRALKGIRNAFAHTTSPLHFKSHLAAPEFQKLSNWTKDAHPHQLFRDSVNACVEALKVPLNQKALIDAIIQHGEKPEAEKGSTKTDKS